MSDFNVSTLLHRFGDKKTSDSVVPLVKKQVLFICTGNIARSASAQYISRSKISPEAQWSFDSAGTGAVVGSGVAPHIDRELDVRGVEYGAHRAKQVTERMIAESALVLVMEKEHLRWLVHEWPQYRSKIHLLGQMARLRKHAARRVDPVAFMQQRVEEPLAADEIADPYRRGEAAAQKAVQEVENALDVIVPWLGH